MKNTIKNLILVASGLVLSGVFFVAPVKAQAAVDLNSQQHEGYMLRVINYTLNPGGTNWQNSISNVNAGDIISLNIHYHNFTVGETAQNVQSSINVPSGASNNFTISTNVWANNSAQTYTDTVSINLNSNQSLSFVPGSVRWYPGPNLAITPLPNGQSGDNIISGGVSVGNVLPGNSASGQIVLHLQVSNNSSGGAPTVTTVSAINVNDTSATLRGIANPRGADTQTWFEYGTSYSLGNQTSTTNIGSGNADQNLSQVITGLQPNTTYYYKAVAQNQYGTVPGVVMSFYTTGQQQGNAPTATTNTATGVDNYSATLRGDTNPNGYNTTAWFEYGTNNSFNYTTQSTSVGSGNSSQSVQYYVSGLTPNTNYTYRIAAQNQYGTTRGSPMNFYTTGGGGSGSAPIVTTNYPTDTNSNSATFRGDVNPNNSYATSWFEYSTNQYDVQNGSAMRTSESSVGSSNYNQGITQYVSGLNNNATYYYRAAARNSYGTNYGSIVSFYTSGGGGGCAPYVTTYPASFITDNSASLRASVNSGSSNSDTTSAWFEYGPNYSMSNRTSYQTFYGGSYNYNYNQDFIRYLSNLQTNTNYSFRVVAQNSCGTSYGSTLTFSTTGGGGSSIVNTLAATNVGRTYATLNGEVNPGGSNNSASWFEYSTDPNLSYSLTTQSANTSYGNYLRQVSTPISNLSAGVTYYFRAVLRNDNGTYKGGILSFTTGGVTPGPTPTYSDMSVWKEVKNLTFPNGTLYVNSASIGDVVEYDLNVKNTGSDTLNNVTVKDTIPSYYDVVDAGAGYNGASGSGNALSWSVGSIAPGENKIIYVKVKARTTEQSVVVYNSFTASAGGSTRTSNKTTTILNPSMMALDMSADKGTVDRGGNFSYSVRYRNIGINDIDNAVIKVSMPDAVKLVSSSPNASSADGNVYYFKIGRVSKGQMGSIDIQAKVNEDAEVGTRQVATAVLDFTDIFGTPQRNVSVSAAVDVGTGLVQLASAVGLSFGGAAWWVYLLWFLIILLVLAIVYLYFRISRLLKNSY